MHEGLIYWQISESLKIYKHESSKESPQKWSKILIVCKLQEQIAILFVLSF